ncbi:MAG: FHA domain-containing protein, partial [Planctomycetota bacterium]
MSSLLAESGPFEGRSIPVTDGLLVGRLESCDIALPLDDEVSRRHLTFRLVEGRAVAVDLDSRNGTRVNGKSIKEHRLRDGDRVEVGGSVLRFEEDGARREAPPVAKAQLASKVPPAPEESARNGEPAAVSRKEAAEARSETRTVIEVVLLIAVCVLVFGIASLTVQIVMQLIARR